MLNLVLIGYMGTGKTTVGRKLAKKLGLKFIDTDHEIERVTGMPVNDIFKKLGEVRFRSEEKAAVRRVSREHGQVIATGGGVVLDPENMELLKETGVVVRLLATPETIYDRVKRKKTRPLLQTDDPLQKIKDMLAEREPLYSSSADETVDTTQCELDEVVAIVGRMYRELCAGRKA